MNLCKPFSIVWALLGTSFLLTANDAKAVTDSVLYCRGGGSGYVFVTNDEYEAGKSSYAFDFTPGTQAYAGITFILPGACQWSNRAFQSGDPTILMLTVFDDNNETVIKANGTFGFFISAHTWINSWSDPNAIIEFSVHSDGSEQVIDNATLLSK